MSFCVRTAIAFRSGTGTATRGGRLARVKNRKGIIIVGGKRRRRRMSKAARAKISAAQKARWAKQKAGKS
jgi:hypothetical protein